MCVMKRQAQGKWMRTACCLGEQTKGVGRVGCAKFGAKLRNEESEPRQPFLAQTAGSVMAAERSPNGMPTQVCHLGFHVSHLHPQPRSE